MNWFNSAKLIPKIVKATSTISSLFGKENRSVVDLQAGVGLGVETISNAINLNTSYQITPSFQARLTELITNEVIAKWVTSGGAISGDTMTQMISSVFEGLDELAPTRVIYEAPACSCPSCGHHFDPSKTASKFGAQAIFFKVPHESTETLKFNDPKSGEVRHGLTSV